MDRRNFKEIVLKAEDGIVFDCSRTGKTIYARKERSDYNLDLTNFMKIGKHERDVVKSWIKTQIPETDEQKQFLKIVREALNNVRYDYWISTIEPSKPKDKIEFIDGEEVAVGYSINQWIEMFKAYMPERGSRMANLYELFIWYAWRIAKSFWTLVYVADDSSSAGNYWNAPGATHCIEKAGARGCGGFRDGQGNTYKLVTHKDSFAAVGGRYDNRGINYPVADVDYNYNPNNIPYYGCGVLVLTK